MQTHQFQIRESTGGLVPFKARILAAIPGKSLNNRIYTKEVLQQSALLYDGKPFIMDHDIEHVERVVGIFSHPRYAVERGMDGNAYEGLWLDAVGLMDENLFDKVRGRGLVPPLVRGFSIGGEGEGDFQADGGVLIKRFIPAEGSVTAFPGIPAAHIAAVNAIRESYLNHSREVKKTSIPVKETTVSLEEAEKQAVKTREGPLPGPDSNIRPLRGQGFPQNDVRPGLPAPTVRKQVVHVQPQATTSADTGVKLDGALSPGSAPALATGSRGASNEQVPGTAGRGAKGSKDAKPFKPKIPRTGATTTKSPGFGKASPSGTGLTDQPEEEEEESRAREDMTIGAGTDQPPLPRGTTRTPTTRDHPNISGKVTAPGDYPDDVKQLINPVSVPSEERRTREQEDGGEEDGEEEDGEEDHPGKQCGDAHPGMSHDDFMDKQEEEGEEEESRRVRVRHDDEPVGGKKSMNPFHPDKDEDEEEEEHGPSPHIPGKPVGKVGGHQPDNAYDSPADKPEEEEEEMENPLLRTAGQGQNVGANPIRAGGEEALAGQDIVPVQAAAYSLPVDTGIYQMAMRLDKMRNPDRTKEVQGYIAKWNDAKKPPETPLRKVRVKTGRQTESVMSSGTRTTIPTIQPTISPREEIRTKSLTNIAPTMYATSTVSTLATNAAELLEKVKSKPFAYWNPAGRAWREMLPQMLDVR